MCAIRPSSSTAWSMPARLYLPRGVDSAPGIVVVHGMHELGINGPRLVSFARSLAAGGFFVMTPQVPGIADYRVEAESADLIGTATQNFAHQLQVPKVGVLALSFSGGLALLAASDPRYLAIHRMGGDGGCALRSGACSALLRHRRRGAARWIGRASAAPRIWAADRGLRRGRRTSSLRRMSPAAHEAIRLLLSGKGKASEELAKTLTPAGQETMQRIYHKQREDFAPALLAEIDKRREQLAAGFSRRSSQVSNHAGFVAARLR